MANEELRAATAELPIWSVLGELRQALAVRPRAVLTAAPGAGKSTVVPLALADEPWLAGRRILMLEPRRLAARTLAGRLAVLSGQPLGGRVGLVTRDQRIVGRHTRIEVLTEAVLTRRLLRDPELPGVGLVIFDEFHERSQHADLGLALVRDVQATLREDLRVLLMSATLDARRLATELDAAEIHAEGREYPVEIVYRPPRPETSADAAVAAAVREALVAQPGSVLAFLPGEGEIQRVARRLADAPAKICPLFGRQSRAAQAAALAPAPAGERKVVLATAVAETSLTIEGVRVVVDSGWARHAVFDPNAGFSRLVTRRVTADSADQRAGRAGRLEPGVAYRLWSADEALAPERVPELRQADLAPVALQVAAWGSEPAWLEAPPAGAWAQAQDLLRMLGLLDAEGRITSAGRQVVAWGAHPRIGALFLAGQAQDAAAMACDLAALIEQDRRSGAEPDLHAEWLAWRRGGMPGERARLLERETGRWRQRLGLDAQLREADPGPLLAAGFADRIARRRGGERRDYRLANGRGATLPEGHALQAREWLVVVDLDGGREARIRAAAAYSEAALREQFAAQIRSGDQLALEPGSGQVIGRRVQRFHALELAEQPLPSPDPEALAGALLEGFRGEALARRLAARGVHNRWRRLCHAAACQADWPAFDAATLAADLDVWLKPWLYGLRRLDQVDDARLLQALEARLTPAQQRALERLAPRRWRLPGGREVKIDYTAENGPVLAVRLQDLLGQAQTPTLAGRPLLLQLLSPAGRPLAVTRDLASFWAGPYQEVRKQMRGRYPKHRWPEDPLSGE